MSRPRGDSGYDPLPGSQCEASPPLSVLLCRSQRSPSTPLRVFGSEITNRLPTPPPPRISSSSPLTAAAPLCAATATLCSVAIDAPLSYAPPGPASSSSWLEVDPYCCPSNRGDVVEPSLSYETLLGAKGSACPRQGPFPLAGVGSRSSGNSTNSRVTLQTVGGGDQSCLELPHCSMSGQAETSMPSALSAKRRLRDGGTENSDGQAGPRSSWPHVKRQRGEEAANSGLTGAFSATAPLPRLPAPPMRTGGVGVPGGADSICCGGDVDARLSLVTSSSEYDGDPWDPRRGACGFLTPVSTKLLSLPPVALVPLPPSQHLHARVCRPASLLDKEHAAPAWQVLTSGPAATEEEEEGLVHLVSTSRSTTLFSPARGNVLLCNAVDGAISYSPLTLDDISPILCLSEERLEHCRMSAVACDRHPSAEVDDEESMGGVAPDLSTQCFTGSARFVHEEALRLLTATCEDAEGALLQWPG
ncbi:hypothetical protein NXY56_004534 [Leishmania guyanensis]|uniref:Ig-like domain-containing protein n=2 Tax=Leishmania guyanensis species complex TaxID=38579 RepID=A0AAW3BM85_9TRYP